ncbi:MAG: hypothetical protein ABMB14_13245 [Myxococcota bacterium]
MGYTSPHDGREYLVAACLQVNHDHVIRCQARSNKWKKAYLGSTREIDLCAGVKESFGPSAHLGAQSSKSLVDLDIRGPTIKAEVKYLRGRHAWTSIVKGNEKGIKKDWTWLLGGTNTNDEFLKRAWIVFWPAISLFSFNECMSITRAHGTRYDLADIAPFIPITVRSINPTSGNQELAFVTSPSRVSLLVVGGKRVRVDLVGGVGHPVWCAIYTRVTSAQGTALGLPAGDVHTVTPGPAP